MTATRINPEYQPKGSYMPMQSTDTDAKFVHVSLQDNITWEQRGAAILEGMKKGDVHSFQFGTCWSSGMHVYIAHRYPSWANYGVVMFFNVWDNVVLYKLNNGTQSVSYL